MIMIMIMIIMMMIIITTIIIISIIIIIIILIIIIYQVSGSQKTWFLENRKNPFGHPIRIPCSCGSPIRTPHSDTLLMRIRAADGNVSFGSA